LGRARACPSNEEQRQWQWQRQNQKQKAETETETAKAAAAEAGHSEGLMHERAKAVPVDPLAWIRPEKERL
jgi:hypothetical protein